MSTSIQLKRGSRAVLDAHAQKGKLATGEPLLIQDEERLAIALSPTSYVSFAKSQEIDALSSDDVLHASEKPAVVQEYNVLLAERAAIDAAATTYAITTEKTAYGEAITSLTTYLGTLPGWNVVPGTEVAIEGDLFRLKFHNVYAAREVLKGKITEAVAVALAAAEIPETLAELNPAEGAKLSAIESGATRNVARGEWATATVYARGDTTTLEGSTWSASVGHTSGTANKPPADPATLSATWLLVAERGEQGVSYDIEIRSTNGTTFRVGNSVNTLLQALVFKNGVNVTDTTPSGWFQWRRVSGIPREPPYDDATWNALYSAGYKSIALNVDDVHARATFFCDITSP